MRRIESDERVVDLLPGVHALQAPAQQGYRNFSYVIERGSTSVLVDAFHPDHIELLDAFPPPSALVLTHRHTRMAEAAYEARFGLKVYLRPEDAGAPRRGPATGTPHASRYHDPTDDPVLRDLGLRFIHVPGHTPGFTFIVWEEQGGVLLSGDAVIGPRQGNPVALEWPPPQTSDDDGQMRASVSALDRPRVRHVLPFHGDPLLDIEPERFDSMWAALVD